MPVENVSTNARTSRLAADFERHAIGDGTLETRGSQAVLQALEAGQTVTFLREMNTQAFLRATVGDQVLISKF